MKKSKTTGSYLGIDPLRWAGPFLQVQRVNRMHGDPNVSGLGNPGERLENPVGFEKCRKE